MKVPLVLGALSTLLPLSLSHPIHSWRRAVGAVYFMTNQDRNLIISSSIAPDGSVNLSRAISTHGRGGAGVVETPGPDPLFSQDSVKVSGSFLYAVNAGSNTVSMFKISRNDPTVLWMVGNPIGSEGEFPVAVAASEARNMVCVLNGGAVNGVSCYTPHPHIGLRAIPGTTRSLNISQTTPPSGPAGTVSDIIFNEDGTQLLVTVKGVPPNPGFLAAWDVYDDGTLSDSFTPSTPAAGGLLPFSATPINNKNALLVTDPGVGFSVYDLNTLSVENNTPAQSSIVPIEGQIAVCWSNFSPRTGNFYLTDTGTSMVTEASVSDSLQGAVVKQYQLAANSLIIDNAIVSLPNNDFLYVLSAGTTSIDVLALNAPGNATHLQTLDFGSLLKWSGIKVDGNRVQGMAVFMKGD